jgi:hypothetical protein
MQLAAHSRAVPDDGGLGERRIGAAKPAGLWAATATTDVRIKRGGTTSAATFSTSRPWTSTWPPSRTLSISVYTTTSSAIAWSIRRRIDTS